MKQHLNLSLIQLDSRNAYMKNPFSPFRTTPFVNPKPAFKLSRMHNFLFACKDDTGKVISHGTVRAISAPEAMKIVRQKHSGSTVRVWTE